MKMFLLTLAVIGALFVVASGIWVAIALVRVISADQASPESESDTPAND